MTGPAPAAAPVPAPRPFRTRRTVAPQVFFGTLIMISFFGVILIMCWHSVPPENAGLLDTLIGFLGGAFTATVAFYFGTTAASREKDATISQLAVTPTGAPS